LQVFQSRFSPATKISPALSSKIKTLNFIGIVCVMYIHSFNEEPVYLQPHTRPKENTFSVAIQFFLAGALLRFVVPFFFAVSGYLFFVCKVVLHPSVTAFKQAAACPHLIPSLTDRRHPKRSIFAPLARARGQHIGSVLLLANHRNYFGAAAATVAHVQVELALLQSAASTTPILSTSF
jgi:hypothetical protein